MVKLYAEENTIFMKDELTGTVVGLSFYFDPPRVDFNPCFDFASLKEEIEAQKAAITLVINEDEDSDLFQLIAPLLKEGLPYTFVSDSPISHYVNVKGTNVLTIVNNGKNVIIKLAGNRSETSTNVYLKSDDPNLSLLYKIINALASYLNILNSHDIQAEMAREMDKMLRRDR